MIKKLFIAAVLFLSQVSLAQITIKKNDEEKTQDPKGFYFGLGAELSSINIFRNYRSNPYHLGFNGRAYYQFQSNIRLMGEYTFIPKFNVEPTWLNVTNTVVGANMSILARIKDETAMFYTITGICYQRWKGFYTGINDFNVGTKHTLAPNNIYTTQYMGLNLGVGFEKSFSYDQLFGEFRYRFSKTESGFGITDAAFTAGIKVKINAREPQKKLHGKYRWF
ncbi:MAG: hypothetical protein ACJ76F_09545 [Bacteroidia bacterium]